MRLHPVHIPYFEIQEERPMSEQNSCDEFTKLRTKIKSALNEDMCREALDFVSYLKLSDMTLDPNTNVFKYLDKEVCCLTLDGDSHPCGPWSVYWGDFDIYEQDNCKVDDRLKSFVLDHIHFCSVYQYNTRPHCNHSPGKNRMIFGNTYRNVCTSSLQFPTPDAKDVKYIKELAELRKRNILAEIQDK